MKALPSSSNSLWRLPSKAASWLLALLGWMLVGVKLGAMVDLNDNQMSDVWESAYSARDIDPLADPDGDGQSNRKESVAGTNPFDPGSVLRLQSTQFLDAAYLLHWPSVEGKQYRIEAAHSMEDPYWIPQGPAVAGTGANTLWAIPTTNPPLMAFRVRVSSDNPAVEEGRIHIGSLDTDKDGMPDIDEFDAGTNPFDPSSCLAVDTQSTGQALLMSWDSVQGKTYQLEFNNDVGTSRGPAVGTSVKGTGSRLTVAVGAREDKHAPRLLVTDTDTDRDGITDWECALAGIPVGSTFEAPLPTSSLTEALVSHWKLDEHGPGSRADACGSNTLQDLYTNVVSGDLGRFRKSARFDSRPSSMLAAPDSPSLRMSNFTLTAWSKLAGSSVPGFKPQHIAGKSEGQATGFSIDYTGNTVNRFRATVGNVSINALFSCKVDTWYFLCARFDGTNLSLSVNNAWQGVIPASPAPHVVTPFTIGARSDSNNPMQGEVDEVRLWSRALTDSEVMQVYSSGEARPNTASSNRLATLAGILSATNVLNVKPGAPVANATTGTPGAFRITRKGNLNALTVNYTVGGNAVPGSHYQKLPGSITLPPGAHSVDVPVMPLGDAGLDPTRSVTLALIGAPDYELGTHTTAQVNLVREVALSVKDFGARGDGSADDTFAIQAAIDALEASATHNTLHFPPGVYRLNTPTPDSSTATSAHRLLKLGNTDLSGRDLFFTGDSHATLFSTVSSVRAQMLMAVASFRSISFRGLTWKKNDTPLPTTLGSPNGASGVAFVRHAKRRVELVDFLDCTFDNCHGAVSMPFRHGYNTRGELALFRFRHCTVLNPFGSNTLEAQKSFGGGQQMRISAWVDWAIYSDNTFVGGGDPVDPVNNPGGVRKDGSHYGGSLHLIFTNNIVRLMRVEAIMQFDDPFIAITAAPLTFPAPGGLSAGVTIRPTESTFQAGQLLNFRTPQTPQTTPGNVLMQLSSYDATTHTLSVTNPGLTPNVAGTTLPARRPVYLLDYNPTFATISDNVVLDGEPSGFIGIESNSKATISRNFVQGYVTGIHLYDNVRNPVNPPTPGTVIHSNIILTRSPSTNSSKVYGIQSWGPGETILNNLIIARQSTRFTGIGLRGRDAWVENNVILPVDVVRQSFSGASRSAGIAFYRNAPLGAAAANKTYGMDVGIGPEIPHQKTIHRVIKHYSTNDVLAVDPRGLTQDSIP